MVPRGLTMSVRVQTTFRDEEYGELWELANQLKFESVSSLLNYLATSFRMKNRSVVKSHAFQLGAEGKDAL